MATLALNLAVIVCLKDIWKGKRCVRRFGLEGSANSLAPTYVELLPGPEAYFRPVPVHSARHKPIESQMVQVRHAKDWMQPLVVHASAHEVPKLQLAPEFEVI